jgi:hypothetical protein
MKKLNAILLSSLTLLFLNSCTSTFGGTVLVLGFKDVILYVGIALILSGLVSFMHVAEKRRRVFIIWFVVSLLLTPLPALIYFLIRLTKKD